MSCQLRNTAKPYILDFDGFPRRYDFSEEKNDKSSFINSSKN